MSTLHKLHLVPHDIYRVFTIHAEKSTDYFRGRSLSRLNLISFFYQMKSFSLTVESN